MCSPRESTEIFTSTGTWVSCRSDLREKDSMESASAAAINISSDSTMNLPQPIDASQLPMRVAAPDTNCASARRRSARRALRFSAAAAGGGVGFSALVCGSVIVVSRRQNQLELYGPAAAGGTGIRRAASFGGRDTRARDRPASGDGAAKRDIALCSWHIIVQVHLLASHSEGTRAMAADADNPMGTDGFEFVEYAAPDPAALGSLFESLGFIALARHRHKRVTLYRQGDINFIINSEPD